MFSWEAQRNSFNILPLSNYETLELETISGKGESINTASFLCLLLDATFPAQTIV